MKKLIMKDPFGGKDIIVKFKPYDEYYNRFLGSSFRSAVLSDLEHEMIDGLTEGMDMINLARFREYVNATF